MAAQNVLLFDDDADLIEIYKLTLEKAGFAVYTAAHRTVAMVGFSF
jgi:DNA-binding response OmpR family regulator